MSVNRSYIVPPTTQISFGRGTSVPRESLSTPSPTRGSNGRSSSSVNAARKRVVTFREKERQRFNSGIESRIGQTGLKVPPPANPSSKGLEFGGCIWGAAAPHYMAPVSAAPKSTVRRTASPKQVEKQSLSEENRYLSERVQSLEADLRQTAVDRGAVENELLLQRMTHALNEKVTMCSGSSPVLMSSPGSRESILLAALMQEVRTVHADLRTVTKERDALRQHMSCYLSKTDSVVAPPTLSVPACTVPISAPVLSMSLPNSSIVPPPALAETTLPPSATPISHTTAPPPPSLTAVLPTPSSSIFTASPPPASLGTMPPSPAAPAHTPSETKQTLLADPRAPSASLPDAPAVNESTTIAQLKFQLSQSQRKVAAWESWYKKHLSETKQTAVAKATTVVAAQSSSPSSPPPPPAAGNGATPRVEGILALPKSDVAYSSGYTVETDSKRHFEASDVLGYLKMPQMNNARRKQRDLWEGSDDATVTLIAKERALRELAAEENKLLEKRLIAVWGSQERKNEAAVEVNAAADP